MKEILANKKLLYGLSGLALIAVLAIVGYFVLRKDNTYTAPVKYTNVNSNTASSSADNTQTTAIKDSFSTLNCKSNASPKFEADLVKPADVKFITPPVRETATGTKTHSAIFVGGSVALYAPTDMLAYDGAYYTEENKNQYLVFFEVSCEVRIVIDHFNQPVDAIKSAFPSTPQANSATNKLANPVSFKKGDLLGYASGTSAAGSWDFGVYNLTAVNPYRASTSDDPSMWRDKNAICPFSYFTDKDTYKALFKNPDGSTLSLEKNLCKDL